MSLAFYRIIDFDNADASLRDIPTLVVFRVEATVRVPLRAKSHWLFLYSWGEGFSGLTLWLIRALG